jgi:hypothetical protein
LTNPLPKSRVLKLKTNPSVAPYVCIIDCVKKNLDQTLQRGFSIGGIEYPQPDHPESNRVNSHTNLCFKQVQVDGDYHQLKKRIR